MAGKLSVDHILSQYFPEPLQIVDRAPTRRSRTSIAGMGEQKIVRIRGG